MKGLSIYSFIFIALLIISCTPEEVKDLKQENKRLKNQMAELNLKVDGYLKTIYEIETNLENIKQREQLIDIKSKAGVEFEENAKESILNDLKAIDELMKENHLKMARLKEDLYDSGLELSKMNNLIRSLEKRMKEKDQVISKLNEKLEGLHFINNSLSREVKSLKFTVDTLEKKNNFYSLVVDTQHETIEEKNRKLNKAYYTTGTLHELKEKKVVKKEGGILGLGSIFRLNEQVDNSYFSVLDMEESFTIPINSSKAELLTNHPVNSYKFEKEINSEKYKRLIIVDPEKFWRSSRYLVVKVN